MVREPEAKVSKADISAIKPTEQIVNGLSNSNTTSHPPPTPFHLVRKVLQNSARGLYSVPDSVPNGKTINLMLVDCKYLLN